MIVIQEKQPGTKYMMDIAGGQKRGKLCPALRL